MGKKKDRSNCIMYGGLNEVYRKRVFLWVTAIGETADLIKSTTHVDVPRLWEKGSLKTGWVSEFFFFNSAEGRQPYNA